METVIIKLLNYCTTNPDSKIWYHASNMTLHIHSNASYLSAPQARSKAGGQFFLSAKPINPKNPRDTKVPLHRPVHSVYTVIRNIMALAAEAKIWALYAKVQKEKELQTALEEMGHPQPLTPIMTDNTTANRIVSNTVKQQRSCAIDMHFCWLRDRCQQGHFQVYWRP
eukprot:15366396-Ditylum_brightwellii.AAC.1